MIAHSTAWEVAERHQMELQHNRIRTLSLDVFVNCTRQPAFPLILNVSHNNIRRLTPPSNFANRARVLGHDRIHPARPNKVAPSHGLAVCEAARPELLPDVLHLRATSTLGTDAPFGAGKRAPWWGSSRAPKTI